MTISSKKFHAIALTPTPYIILIAIEFSRFRIMYSGLAG